MVPNHPFIYSGLGLLEGLRKLVLSHPKPVKAFPEIGPIPPWWEVDRDQLGRDGRL